MNNSIVKSLFIVGMFAQSSAAWCVPGAAWSRLPGGAKEAGLAGGMASLADGLQGSNLAPSSLAGLKGAGAQASHDQWIQGVSQDQVALGYGLSNGVGLALSAVWVDMGEVTRYRAQSSGGMEEAGSWHPNAGTVALSMGAPLGAKLSTGFAVRGWHQSLDGENDMAGSAGASLGYQATQQWKVVASLMDAGSALGPDSLPTTFRVGTAWTGTKAIRLGIEAAAATADPSSLDYSAAMEAPIGKAVTIRGGGMLPANGAAPQLSAGFSFNLGALSLDMAYRPTEALGSALHAGLSWTTR